MWNYLKTVVTHVKWEGAAAGFFTPDEVPNEAHMLMEFLKQLEPQSDKN